MKRKPLNYNRFAQYRIFSERGKKAKYRSGSATKSLPILDEDKR